METAIKKAIEGGYKITENKKACEFNNYIFLESHIFLESLFWKALKVGGKLKVPKKERINSGPASGLRIEKVRVTKAPAWVYYWHCFIDHLAEGKSPDEFFNQLLQ